MCVGHPGAGQSTGRCVCVPHTSGRTRGSCAHVSPELLHYYYYHILISQNKYRNPSFENWLQIIRNRKIIFGY